MTYNTKIIRTPLIWDWEKKRSHKYRKALLLLLFSPHIFCGGHTRYRYDQTWEFRDMPGAQADQSHLCKQDCWLCPPERLRGQRRQLVEKGHGKHWCRSCTQGLAVVQEFAVFLLSSGTEGRWFSRLVCWACVTWIEIEPPKGPCSSTLWFSVLSQNYLYLLYLRAVCLNSTRVFSHCMQFFPVFTKLSSRERIISSTATNTMLWKNNMEASKNNPRAQKQEPQQSLASLGPQVLI